MMCPTELPVRSIVVLADDVSPEEVDAFGARFGEVLHRGGLTERKKNRQWTRTYAELKAVIVPASPQAVRDLLPVGTNRIIAIAEERISRLILDTEATVDEHAGSVEPLWATGVLRTDCSGDGHLVMVLDSGFYPAHNDFIRRNPLPVFDTFTTEKPTANPLHGTRSMGLVGGPLHPSDGRARYGVAHEAKLLCCCVLEGGIIPDAAILDGFRRAIRENASVVSMSFGTPMPKGQEYSIALEIVAQRVLAAGVLPIAAAGNDPSGVGIPVEHPANCPSVLSVGAVDGNLKPLSSSAVRINCDGEVDIVAPGFAIRSSAAGATPYGHATGTSSAAAIASGIAALWAQRTGFRGCDLWNVLVDHAAPVIGGSRRTTGAGLVQAPAPR